MIPFLDANIWLYLANPASPFHDKVKAAVQPHLHGNAEFAVSWQIFYEFIRIATDPRIYTSPVSWKQAYDFIVRVFQQPNVLILQEGPSHSEALEYVMKESGYTRGYFIHDCHIAALLYENGVRTILTTDHDFRRFKFIEVRDPTA